MFPYLSSSLQQRLVSFYQQNGNSQPQNAARPMQKYDLYAVSNHYGGLNGGHYTACVRQPARNAWYNFDDSRVTEICSAGDKEAENTKIKTKAAYSLFYVTWAL